MTIRLFKVGCKFKYRCQLSLISYVSTILQNSDFDLLLCPPAIFCRAPWIIWSCFLSSADFPLDLIMPPVTPLRSAFLSLFEASTPIGLANPTLFIHCKYFSGGQRGRMHVCLNGGEKRKHGREVGTRCLCLTVSGTEV